MLKIVIACIGALAVSLCHAQEKPVQRVIAFWNLENLYDTLDDPLKNDEDFLPKGPYRWIGERYRVKIDRLGEVISLIGTNITPDGPSLLGVCEAENSSVLSDLVNSPRLKSRNYNYILIEGPDARGVDPGLLYNEKHFVPTKTVTYAVTLVTDARHKTRDILVVSGRMDGDNICVLVNHWPSRRGGEIASRPNRVAAGKMARKICDSVSAASPGTKLVIMGDFNDDPVSVSITETIGTAGPNAAFFNPMEAPYKKGIGTLAWQDSWNLFDQIILNDAWKSGNGLQFRQVRIFNELFMRSQQGNFRGYPHRTYSGGKYTGGYSDHFPSYIVASK